MNFEQIRLHYELIKKVKLTKPNLAKNGQIFNFFLLSDSFHYGTWIQNDCNPQSNKNHATLAKFAEAQSSSLHTALHTH